MTVLAHALYKAPLFLSAGIVDPPWARATRAGWPGWRARPSWR